MSYQVFARKYRPQSFQDILGQDAIVQVLQNAITQKRIAQAYLFTGPRGTGKTSTARIFAKALNCINGPAVDFDINCSRSIDIAQGTSLDVIEIDGASNNNVEQIRDLREKAQFPPLDGNYKIYYIDEVHMLSTAAFNALLKILEEPPPHIIFIFSTTDPHKILPTIISRCQRFDLQPIPTSIIAEQLNYITQQENITISPAASLLIARNASGGMRDAQSMLDQMVTFCGENITEEDVQQVFGIQSNDIILNFITLLLKRDTAGVLQAVSLCCSQGNSVEYLLLDILQQLRVLLLYKSTQKADLDDSIIALAKPYSVEKLLASMQIVIQAQQQIKYCIDQRIQLEITCINIIQQLDAVSLDDVIATLEKREKREGVADKASNQHSITTADEGLQDTIINSAVDDVTAATMVTPTADESVVNQAPQTTSTEEENFINAATVASPAIELLEDGAVEDRSDSATTGEQIIATEEVNSAEQSTSQLQDNKEESKEDFYQDPLISQALAIFETEVKAIQS